MRKDCARGLGEASRAGAQPLRTLGRKYAGIVGSRLPLALLGLGDGLRTVQLRGRLLTRALAERILDELAGIAATRPGEALGSDGRFALGADEDFDDLQRAPPAAT